MTMLTTHHPRRTPLVPNRLVSPLLSLTLRNWIGFALAVLGFTVGVAVVSAVDASVWEKTAGFIPWYVLFIGGYLTYRELPRYVAHGATRREFFTQAIAVLVLLSLALAALTALGFLLERALYELAGWPQRITEHHLYTSAAQVHRVLLEYGLVFLVWSATGLLVGAGLYRGGSLGILLLLLALVPVSAAGIAIGADWGPLGTLVDSFAEPGTPPTAVAVAVCLLTALGTLGITWLVIREIAIKPKPE